MTVIRFAPAHNGPIDVEEARRAVLSGLLARAVGGRLVLLLDDLDPGANPSAVVSDLGWLGLDWAAEARLSQAVGPAAEALARLRAASRAYECFETPLELEMAERRARAEGRVPVYDRAALMLTNAEREALRETRNPHLRFLLEPGAIAWDDLVAGPSAEDAGALSDPVLTRGDGQPLPALVRVLADIALGTTHVLEPAAMRAETAALRQLHAALGAQPPLPGHVPALEIAAGTALPTVAALREAGADPGALRVALAPQGARAGGAARISAAPVRLDLAALVPDAS